MSLTLVRRDGTRTPLTRALIDSGCNITTFPKDWAADLGIDFDKDCVAADGVTAAGHDKDQREELRPRIFPPGVEAIFMGEPIHLHASFRPGLPLILLGREDFFVHFRVTLDQRGRRFVLERYR